VGLDPRRKNATRESTSTLKAWLYEHIKNPYPTKGEKIMLAIITKMTLTQVPTEPWATCTHPFAPEGLAVRAHQEPVPDQGREDHAGHHHQDDSDTGNYRTLGNLYTSICS